MAQNLSVHALELFLLITMFLRVLAVETASSSELGFRVELIHRESPLSPFYNPLETTSDRLRRAIHRSISRINRLAFTNNLINNIQSQVIPNSGGDYLMKLSIGSPPIDILAIVDTGSDLTWTQCKPCENCFAQSSPLFDPKQSSTFRDIACGSNSCDQLLGNGRCDANNSSCEYSYYYGDLSHSSGVLAVDKFTFDSTSGSQSTAISNIVFGCGHDNRGSFRNHESGIVGLGGGPLSLVSQLGSKIDGKFSYCLLPMFENSTSKLNFGSPSIVSKQGVVSTPLISKNPSTYYYLTLEGITVGDTRIENKPSDFSIDGGSEGNIIIDSGTTLTLLNEDLYDDLESALKAAINVDTTDDPNEILSLCYNNNSRIEVPEMIFHFTDADLYLNRLNTFIHTPYASLICLAMMPSETAIFGNYAQVNFQVEYDIVGKKVSFAPKDCTNILLTRIVESSGYSQNAIQTSIQNTDEVAVKFFVDQLLKTVFKLSVLFVFVSPYQPFSEDVFSYRWNQPFNLKNGWALWGFGGLIAASSCVLLIKGVTSGLNVSQVQNEAEALLRLAPLIGASNISNVSLLGILGILTPTCEETIYRGFLLTSLSKWLPVNVSVFLSSAVFTLAHQSPGKSAEIFIFGLALGFVYARTRNLLAPITMHVCWNLGVVSILIYFQAQGDNILNYIG